eukprot:TRINITY_DN2174_c0_g1_i1.p1 TRINITY_DN2174_c0_g1~~TRINITY_DN2174_c0_g1_i1.p1  ORF type:complete len:155 (+),score=11.35 TRINITY_DN2174_c0_g1_i1:143-607(+)
MLASQISNMIGSQGIVTYNTFMFIILFLFLSFVLLGWWVTIATDRIIQEKFSLIGECTSEVSETDSVFWGLIEEDFDSVYLLHHSHSNVAQISRIDMRSGDVYLCETRDLDEKFIATYLSDGKAVAWMNGGQSRYSCAVLLTPENLDMLRGQKG